MAAGFWHVTFHPYRRLPVLEADEMRSFLRESILNVARRLDFRVASMAVMPDHVHLLLELPPWLDLVTVIGRIKGYTAQRIGRRFPELREGMGGRFWARGYHYVRHSKASVREAIRYIEEQGAGADAAAG